MARSTESTNELGKMGVRLLRQWLAENPQSAEWWAVVLSAFWWVLSRCGSSLFGPLTRGHPLRSGVSRDGYRRLHFAGEMKADLGFSRLGSGLLHYYLPSHLTIVYCVGCWEPKVESRYKGADDKLIWIRDSITPEHIPRDTDNRKTLTGIAKWVKSGHSPMS
jgi:hypothetical protein